MILSHLNKDFLSNYITKNYLQELKYAYIHSQCQIQRTFVSDYQCTISLVVSGKKYSLCDHRGQSSSYNFNVGSILLLLRGWMIVFPGLVSRSAGVQQLLQGAGAHAALRGQALLNVGHQAGHMAPATSTLNQLYEKIYFQPPRMPSSILNIQC